MRESHELHVPFLSKPDITKREGRVLVMHPFMNCKLRCDGTTCSRCSTEGSCYELSGGNAIMSFLTFPVSSCPEELDRAAS